MLDRLDGYLKAIWARYGLPGVVEVTWLIMAVVVLLILLLAALAWFFGVDVAGLLQARILRGVG
jgi:hypothetical protein